MRRSWAITALGLVLAACGGNEPDPADRFSLRTPTDPPVATATPELQPVTRAEKRVLKGWADSLRGGHVASAAAYFSVPAEITDNASGSARLTTRAEIEEFNRGIPCGAKLLRTRRGPSSFVLGTFRLTERRTKGEPACGASVGTTIVVAFQIKDDHITRWMRDAAALGTVAPTATPPTTG